MLTAPFPNYCAQDNFILFIHEQSAGFFLPIVPGDGTSSTRVFIFTVPAGLRAVLALSHLVNGTHPELVGAGWS